VIYGRMDSRNTRRSSSVVYSARTCCVCEGGKGEGGGGGGGGVIETERVRACGLAFKRSILQTIKTIIKSF